MQSRIVYPIFCVLQGHSKNLQQIKKQVRKTPAEWGQKPIRITVTLAAPSTLNKSARSLS